MTTRLLLKCIEADRCTVLLEPYGAEYVLAADDHLHLEFESGETELVEVAYSPGCIIVWLPASVVRVQARNRLDESVYLGLPL